MERGPSPVFGQSLRVRAHELVEVMALEFRGLSSEGLQVCDPVVAATNGKRGRMCKGAERGEAPGTCPHDHAEAGIGMSGLGEVLGGMDAVGDVGDAPEAIQALPVRTPVAGADSRSERADELLVFVVVSCRR